MAIRGRLGTMYLGIALAVVFLLAVPSLAYQGDFWHDYSGVSGGITAVYNEATGDSDFDSTYWASIGFSDGYMGFQSLWDRSKLLIFSVWDQDSAGAAGKCKVLEVGVGSFDVNFGGEGTGCSLRMKHDWVVGVPLRTLVTAEVTATGTTFAAWFFHQKESRWFSLGRILRRTLAGKPPFYLEGLYSFVENFKSKADANLRLGHFTNTWVYTGGNWANGKELTSGSSYWMSDDATNNGFTPNIDLGADRRGLFISCDGTKSPPSLPPDPQLTRFTRLANNAPPSDLPGMPGYNAELNAGGQALIAKQGTPMYEGQRYRIRNAWAVSGKCLEAQTGAVGEVVRVLPCKAGYYANQAFRLTILWQWIHVPSGRCLDVSSNVDNTLLVLANCDPNKASQRFVSQTGGDNTLQSVLDGSPRVSPSGSLAVILRYLGVREQQWYFQPVDPVDPVVQTTKAVVPTTRVPIRTTVPLKRTTTKVVVKNTSKVTACVALKTSTKVVTRYVTVTVKKMV